MKREKTLYELMLFECINKDMTMLELSEKIGITRATINNTKKSKPTAKTYYKIAQYFDMEPEEIYAMPVNKDIVKQKG